MRNKIAIVIDPWDYPFNGTVVSTRRFINALDSVFEFKLFSTPDPTLTPDPRMAIFPKLSIPGFNRIIDSMRAPLSKPSAALLDKALTDVQLLHVQFPLFLGYGAIRRAKKSDIPCICSFHIQPENLLRNLGIQSVFLSRLLYKLFLWAFYNRVDLVIAPSQFAANLLKSHGLRQPVVVLSNGVPDKFLTVKHSPMRDRNFKVLSVGRLAAEKQHVTMLKAIANSRFRNEVELVIVGTGPLERELKAEAQRLAVSVNIGPVSDDELLRHYAEADLFIHGGEIELEGMSVLEAMAAGNTVIVSDGKDSATPELVDDSRCKFENRNASDLQIKVDHLLADAKLRQTLADRNRVYARKRTHSVSVEQLANIYKRFLQPAVEQEMKVVRSG